ncbi:hypothetical protein Droror1_Dr00015085 [Drosera rotundifolia]
MVGRILIACKLVVLCTNTIVVIVIYLCSWAAARDSLPERDVIVISYLCCVLWVMLLFRKIFGVVLILLWPEAILLLILFPPSHAGCAWKQAFLSSLGVVMPDFFRFLTLLFCFRLVMHMLCVLARKVLPIVVCTILIIIL